MLLSRAAWRLFWIGRLLERAEGQARAVWSRHMMDSHPQARGLAPWRGLLDALGQNTALRAAEGDFANERAILRFMLGGGENPDSLRGVIDSLRESMRSARSFLPTEMWRNAAQLSALAENAARAGANARYDALEQFVRLCRASAGVATTAMRRDEAFCFWQIGRRLECAGVTARVMLWALDEESGDESGEIGDDDEDDERTPIDNLRWVFVLKSMGLTEAYRAYARAPVRGATVVDFILTDSLLPRSIKSCLGDVRDSIERLPANAAPLSALARTARAAARARGERDDCAIRLGWFLASLARTADAVGAAYFPQFK